MNDDEPNDDGDNRPSGAAVWLVLALVTLAALTVGAMLAAGADKLGWL